MRGPDIVVDISPRPLVVEWTGEEAEAIRRLASNEGVSVKEILDLGLRACRMGLAVRDGAKAMKRIFHSIQT